MVSFQSKKVCKSKKKKSQMVDIPKITSNMSITDMLNLAVNAVVRPPRASYNEEEISYIVFDMHLPPIPRIPMSFPNRRGERLVGSLYLSGSFYTEKTHNCIIYLHGNIGSQKEGRQIVPYFAPNGISVFCFDFSGSGNSGGKYVTLGKKEKTDVPDVCTFLHENYEIDNFILWGRSMGAATAILSCQSTRMIRGLIVDSAYSSLEDMLDDVSKKLKMNSVSSMFASWFIKKGVYDRVGLSINDVQPAEVAKTCWKPLLLGHSPEDDFIPFSQAEKIYKAYGGPKEIVILTGPHNSPRDENWIKPCRAFIGRVLGIPMEELEMKVTQESAPEHVATFMSLLGEEGI
ncbi:Clan SC, family S9, unassigned serine peptidase [Tritrichomonas foetus]|uniref:Clan SC, family S9, unassigned serine peptidase n=1 Tax=Tritrichomonas foetus TaxID=1144522 RepID=A0A1J4KYJ1_9EUKA|nr:Clan SC, family S9, unassigned serine peptidase [Tritrichomonas foetus]|eukprot:OHT16303.1 Clan SC, family S9, unassigned serine peptidase [Tritrichomonas foetus]